MLCRLLQLLVVPFDPRSIPSGTRSGHQVTCRSSYPCHGLRFKPLCVLGINSTLDLQVVGTWSVQGGGVDWDPGRRTRTSMLLACYCGRWQRVCAHGLASLTLRWGLASPMCSISTTTGGFAPCLPRGFASSCRLAMCFSVIACGAAGLIQACGC